MGSGKSLLGKKLAALLQMEFIDLDHCIEAGEQNSIADIFRLQGEGAFRDIETAYLERIIAQPAAIIALGGGTVCFHQNLEKIKAAGFLVYIELSAAALSDRLKKNGQKRPLLNGLSGEALTRHIAVLLGERQKFYEQAHLRVQGLNLTPQLLQQKISEAIAEHTR